MFTLLSVFFDPSGFGCMTKADCMKNYSCIRKRCVVVSGLIESVKLDGYMAADSSIPVEKKIEKSLTTERSLSESDPVGGQ